MTGTLILTLLKKGSYADLQQGCDSLLTQEFNLVVMWAGYCIVRE